MLLLRRLVPDIVSTASAKKVVAGVDGITAMAFRVPCAILGVQSLAF
jgi:hypothetical protein